MPKSSTAPNKPDFIPPARENPITVKGEYEKLEELLTQRHQLNNRYREDSKEIDNKITMQSGKISVLISIQGKL